MKDKYEITIFGHMNFIVSYELYDSFNRKNEDIKISELLNRTEKNLGLNKDLQEFYEFINPSNIFSLLYTSLVIPKELFQNQEMGEAFFSNFNEEIEDYFTIIKGEKYLDKQYDFLRKLRNAVSHAHFEWGNCRNKITLWDEWKKEVNFQVETDLNKLTNFCLNLSKYLADNQDKISLKKL